VKGKNTACRWRNVAQGAERRAPVRWVWPILAIGIGLTSSPSLAAVRQWRNPQNGLFQDSSKWVGGMVPGAADTAAFGLNGSTAPFAVTFNAHPIVLELTVTKQRPTFELGGFTFNTALVTIGGSSTPNLTVRNGTLVAGGAIIGHANGAPGTATVEGPTAVW